MKIRTIILCSVAAMMTGCAGEFNRVIKSSDYDYRYEYAKQCFAEGKFGRAEILLQDLITLKKGTDEAEEALYMLAMSQYMNHDFESAAATFRKYFSSYPKGFYAEQAMFYVGQSFELQDKLVMKELLSAQLYYNLGGYFGNINSNSESNYSSSIIVAQNALKTYPYSNHREEFSLLIMKSKFELAENSSADRKLERYQDAEDECYGFLNEYPESKDKALAEKYIEKCKKITKD